MPTMITCLRCGTVNMMPADWGYPEDCWNCLAPLGAAPAKAEESFARALAEAFHSARTAPLPRDETVRTLTCPNCGAANAEGPERATACWTCQTPLSALPAVSAENDAAESEAYEARRRRKLKALGKLP